MLAIMDCYTSRLSSFVTIYLIALGVAAIVNALSVVVYPQTPTGKLAVESVMDLTVHPYLDVSEMMRR